MSLSESQFDEMGRSELLAIEDALANLDPDDVETVKSDGVLTIHLRNGVRVVVNTHRAARQIWMAAVSQAWHFSPPSGEQPGWTTDSGAELRSTLSQVIAKQIGLNVTLSMP